MILAETGFGCNGCRNNTSVESLAASREDMKVILSSISTGITIIDPETHEVIGVNEAALALFGRSREEVIGACCHSFICPAEKGKCPITDLKAVIDHSERTLLDGSGKPVPILKTVVPVTLHGRHCLLENFVDISQRKQAEEALKRTQDELITASRLAGMAEVATSVLHNVGNVLNSVNVSASVVADQLKLSKAAKYCAHCYNAARTRQ